jgi:hypothetical protein
MHKKIYIIVYYLWGQGHLACEVCDVSLQGEGGGGKGDAVELEEHLYFGVILIGMWVRTCGHKNMCGRVCVSICMYVCMYMWVSGSEEREGGAVELEEHLNGLFIKV